MRCPILTACRNGSLGSGCNGRNGGKCVANERLQTEEDAFKTWERSLIEACNVNVTGRERNVSGDLTQNICVNAARDTHSDDLRCLTVSRIVIAQLNKVTLRITLLPRIHIICIGNSHVTSDHSAAWEHCLLFGRRWQSAYHQSQRWWRQVHPASCQTLCWSMLCRLEREHQQWLCSHLRRCTWLGWWLDQLARLSGIYVWRTVFIGIFMQNSNTRVYESMQLAMTAYANILIFRHSEYNWNTKMGLAQE